MTLGSRRLRRTFDDRLARVLWPSAGQIHAGRRFQLVSLAQLQIVPSLGTDSGCAQSQFNIAFAPNRDKRPSTPIRPKSRNLVSAKHPKLRPKSDDSFLARIMTASVAAPFRNRTAKRHLSSQPESRNSHTPARLIMGMADCCFCLGENPSPSDELSKGRRICFKKLPPTPGAVLAAEREKKKKKPSFDDSKTPTLLN